MSCTQSDSNHYPRQLPSSMHPGYIIYWHREPAAPSSTHLKIRCEPMQVVHVQVCSVLLSQSENVAETLLVLLKLLPKWRWVKRETEEIGEQFASSLAPRSEHTMHCPRL